MTVESETHETGTPGLGRRAVLRWLEAAMVAIGIASLAGWCVLQLDATLATRRLQAQLAALDEATSVPFEAPSGALGAQAPGARSTPTNPAGSPPRDALIGRLEIPQAEISAVVLSGIDATTLRRGVGHIPGTSLPGEDGNVGLAAHRDQHFRNLDRVRLSDLIEVTTRDGTYQYRVTGMEVVPPDRISVLEPGERPSLTLVTCYPFVYLGRAPKRFVVFAELVTVTTGPPDPPTISTSDRSPGATLQTKR